MAGVCVGGKGGKRELQSGYSMSNRTQFGSAIEPSTLTVPQNKTFNVYLAPPDAPVRAVEIYSFGGYCVTWIYLLPNVVFPLQTRNPITVNLYSGAYFNLDKNDNNLDNFVNFSDHATQRKR